MEYEIYHSGVKGMKWGVRRYQNKDGSLTPAGKKRYSSDDPKTKIEQKPAKPKKRQAKDMTDEELRKEINRLQMEQQYKQLTKRHRSAGEKFVTEVAVGIAKDTAKYYGTKYAKKGIEYLITKIGDRG